MCLVGVAWLHDYRLNRTLTLETESVYGFNQGLLPDFNHGFYQGLLKKKLYFLTTTP